MKPTRPIKAALWLMVAACAFFVMAASSPQCARSSDRALNPTLDTLAGGNPCIAACQDAFKAGQKAEQARHKAALTACNGNPACKQAESDLHSAIMDELVSDKDDCKLACQHQQGTATGGQ